MLQILIKIDTIPHYNVKQIFNEQWWHIVLKITWAQNLIADNAKQMEKNIGKIQELKI